MCQPRYKLRRTTKAGKTDGRMAICLIIGATFGFAIIADTLVRPRGLRSLAGVWLGFLPILALFGFMLALDGNMLAAALVATGVATGLGLISNAKRAVLGEPLQFADLAMLTAVFRHPQFYLYALQRWQLAALVLGAAALVLALALAFDGRPVLHLAGVLILLGSMAAIAATLRLPPWRGLAPVVDVDADVAAHGLLASLLLYWHRWRASVDPPPCTEALPAVLGTELIIAVQCESFADPADLFGNPALAMPGLTAARQAAWAHGGLLVSCFGAYTMRAEYGLIFGRDEAALGFRRFNPYLTALGEASHALPGRLARIGWRNLFIHPHDLSFYGRDVILPAAGFGELVGPQAFAQPTQGRYVTDAAMADMILARARAAVGPCYIHAVTIENHGPWPIDQAGDNCPLSSVYLQLVGRGDAMLAQLMAGVAALQRPAVLLFYGDHRPSIPGAVMPGGDRRTPYVLLRFGADGAVIPGPASPRDLTPAELHQALITAISTATVAV
jgi:hypothetical protein